MKSSIGLWHLKALKFVKTVNNFNYFFEKSQWASAKAFIPGLFQKNEDIRTEKEEVMFLVYSKRFPCCPIFQHMNKY